jgi:hypothetical protein
MKRFSIVLAVLAAIAMTVLVASATAGSGHRTFAPKDCVKPKVEPSRIVFSCADFGSYINQLQWKHWGAHRARGKGSFKEKVCKPSCAEGHFRSFAAKIRLQKVRKDSCGGRKVHMFQLAYLRFPGKKPQDASEFHKNKLFCNA